MITNDFKDNPTETNEQPREHHMMMSSCTQKPVGAVHRFNKFWAMFFAALRSLFTVILQSLQCCTSLTNRLNISTFSCCCCCCCCSSSCPLIDTLIPPRFISFMFLFLHLLHVFVVQYSDVMTTNALCDTVFNNFEDELDVSGL